MREDLPNQQARARGRKRGREREREIRKIPLWTLHCPTYAVDSCVQRSGSNLEDRDLEEIARCTLWHESEPCRFPLFSAPSANIMPIQHPARNGSTRKITTITEGESIAMIRARCMNTLDSPMKQSGLVFVRKHQRWQRIWKSVKIVDMADPGMGNECRSSPPRFSTQRHALQPRSGRSPLELLF